MRANRNIIRLDRQSNSCYLVRITRKGKLHSKSFWDDDHGGKRKALIAARQHRDQLEKRLRGYSAKQLSQVQRTNTTSGIVGVRMVEEVDFRWKSKPVYRYWVAQWSPEKGVRRTKRFSVDKYGEDEAYRLAVQARKRGVAAMKQ